jgi:crossover junction endodeoxyribonuclease RuvC
MRVLGLDPGSRRTGYGVVEKRGNAYLCVAHGHVAPPAKATLPERLHHICTHVSEVLARVRPDCVVIEAAFYSKNVRSTLVLGHVRGALMLIAAQQGVEIAEYSPREIKLAVTGNGGADKEQVQAMVSRMLALREDLQADAADALAGALCHLSRSRIAPVRTSARGQRAALEALIARSAVRVVRAAAPSANPAGDPPRREPRTLKVGGSRGLK